MTAHGYCQRCTPKVLRRLDRDAEHRALREQMLPEIEAWDKMREAEELELWAAHAETEI